MITLGKDYFTTCVCCNYSFECVPLDSVKLWICQRKYQRWRYWMPLVLQKINKLKMLTWQPEIPWQVVGCLHSKTAFKLCSFLQQDRMGRKGWNNILKEKKIFLAVTSKLFNSNLLFTPSAVQTQQGQEKQSSLTLDAAVLLAPFSRSMCVLPALRSTWPWWPGGRELFQEGAASSYSPGSSRCFCPWQCFRFFFLPFHVHPFSRSEQLLCNNQSLFLHLEKQGWHLP